MKIGTVSKKTGLGIHTIRYYEKQALIKQLEKDASGHRIYNAQDVDMLNWISCMKSSGMSLNKIKRYTSAFYGEEYETCIAFLEEHLQHLTTQKANIAHYIDVTNSKIIKFKKYLT